MIVLQAQKVSKSWAGQQVLREVGLAVNEKERVGLVGVNGSGKTTLLRCITGEIMPDEGEVVYSAHLSLGFLEQMPDRRSDMTAWEVVMESFTHLVDKRSLLQELEKKMGEEDAGLDKVMQQYARISEEYERANGYACENTARRILSGLGFKEDEYQQTLDTFSGGQKTRLNLGRLLAQAPDILLLDEPTNHLDMNSLEWLENYITDYPGTVLLVSHDRMFLDRVATRIAELRGGRLKSYAGNYSAYLKKKAEEDLAGQRAYQKQQLHIQMTEDYIRRFKAGIKSRQARGRQSQLERVVRLEAPQQEGGIKQQSMKVSHASGNDVLTVKEAAKSFSGRDLFKNVNLSVQKGEKLALIGPNGCGKTTFLRLIKGELPADRGEIILGSRVKIAYLAQEYESLNPDYSVLDEIFYNYDLTLEEARTLLGGMLFSGDQVFKRVGDLSGGEKGRLSFLKMLLSGANFLLLDEPTNHLDIAGRQVVEKILADFEGTVLLVCHDRYFIDQVADRILAVEEGQIEYYWGNYSYYHEKIQARKRAAGQESREEKKAVERPDRYLREAEKELKKARRGLTRELTALEEGISQMENRKTELETHLSDPSTYGDEEKARAYTLEYRQLEQDLQKAYDHWDNLHQQLEEISPAGGEGSI